MLLKVTPDFWQRFGILSTETDHELDEGGSLPLRSSGLIHEAVVPGGRPMPLLKILLTSRCLLNCGYCTFSSQVDRERFTLEPDQLAAGFMELVRRRRVRGIFLSSAVGCSPVTLMDRLLDTVTLIRHRYGFKGYIHLKLLPGAEADQIRQAVTLADRVSVNFETVSARHLERIAPAKRFTADLERVMRTAAAEAQSQGVHHKAASLTTQLVVGPAGETDRELLSFSTSLYRRFGLRRVYYSAFSPTHDNRLPQKEPTPKIRQNRLYQADFLLRDYGFSADELVFFGQDTLLTDLDPKLAWARANPQFYPIEVNRAELAQLLRVPGIGPSGARGILERRRKGRLARPSDLRGLGISLSKALPFLLLGGCRAAPPTQLPLPFGLPG